MRSVVRVVATSSCRRRDGAPRRGTERGSSGLAWICMIIMLVLVIFCAIIIIISSSSSSIIKLLLLLFCGL